MPCGDNCGVSINWHMAPLTLISITTILSDGER
jgi:hypothetical protein